MNSYEEELQKKFEKGEIPDGDRLDVKAYQQVFRALKNESGYELPSGFGERVASSVMARRQARYRRDYFWFGAGIFFLLMACIGTVLFIGFRFDFGFLSVMSDYKGLAVFGIVFILLLNWLDRHLIKNKQVQH